MAQTVHAFLKVNGEDVQGESSQVSEGRENSIECTYFESEAMTAREVQSGATRAAVLGMFKDADAAVARWRRALAAAGEAPGPAEAWALEQYQALAAKVFAAP